MKAIAEDRDRILLTLATGTGKTFIAFQIAWKLFHSRWNLTREASRRPRILFLADRNILANQAYNEFSAFPEDALVRIAPDEIRKKIMPAFTDPARLRKSDPGNPEICAVYTWYEKFLPEETALAAEECRSAARGCVDCKKILAEGVIEHFAPLRERRAGFEADQKALDEIIHDGCRRAREAARRTMEKVHDAMGLG